MAQGRLGKSTVPPSLVVRNLMRGSGVGGRGKITEGDNLEKMPHREKNDITVQELQPRKKAKTLDRKGIRVFKRTK